MSAPSSNNLDRLIALRERGATVVVDGTVENRVLQEAKSAVKVLHAKALEGSKTYPVLNDSSTIQVEAGCSSIWSVHASSPRTAFDIDGQMDNESEAVIENFIQPAIAAAVQDPDTNWLSGAELHGPTTIVISPGVASKQTIGRVGTDCQVPHRDTTSAQSGNYCLIVGIVGEHVLWFFPGTQDPAIRGVEMLSFCPGTDAELRCEMLPRKEVRLDSKVVRPGMAVLFDRRLIHYLGSNTGQKKTYLAQKYISVAPIETRLPVSSIVSFLHQ